ncbi:MAG: thiamine diphosphokinase [Parachlamydiales bacterium]|nr:thiamine diphosphokinase [Parachlamydiales bacterium]
MFESSWPHNKYEPQPILMAVNIKLDEPIALIAAGEFCNSLAKELSQYPTLVAIDGGMNHLKKLNITPHLIVGDLDSIEHYDSSIETWKLDIHKDHSDLEIAIMRLFEAGAHSLNIYGALGGRADHALYNLRLACQYAGQIILVTPKQTIRALKKNYSKRLAVGKTISLMPLIDSVTNVKTNGLKWPLNGQNLSASFCSLSNVTSAEEYSITFDQGTPLLFEEKN